jgi:CheY-like chemotaxis protein
VIGVRPRILVVEDSSADVRLLREAVREHGISVDLEAVADGERALGRLRDGGDTPDLVLLDLNLPGVDGRRVLAEMRLHSQLRAIPVVVLTSSDAASDITGSYEAGASCYVTKPGELTAFQSAVRSIEAFWFKVAKLP